MWIDPLSRARKTVRVSAEVATQWKARVEQLVVARRYGTQPDKSTLEWIASLPENESKRLVRAGLIDKVETYPNEQHQVVDLGNPQPLVGIYFIFAGEKLAYIGKSVNAMVRVLRHVQWAGNEPWNTEDNRQLQQNIDRVVVVKSPERDLLRLEGAFIRLLSPLVNQEFPPTDADSIEQAKSIVCKNPLLRKLLKVMPEPEKRNYHRRFTRQQYQSLVKECHN